MIDNFFEDSYHSYDKVYDHPDAGASIFLGDMQAALDDDFLRNQKIKTVITAATDMDHIVMNQQIQHIVYPLLDSKQENISSFFESFYELVEKSILNGNILVHCAAGISRSSTLVISYIMKKQRKSFKESISVVRKARPNVLPNLGFERQLKNYQQQLTNATKKSNLIKRNEARTAQSSKRPYILKTEFSRQQDDSGRPNLSIHVIPLNIRKLEQKYTQKDLQILKIYSNSTNYNYYCQALKNRIRFRKFTSKHQDKTSSKPEAPRRSSLSDSFNSSKKVYNFRTKTQSEAEHPSKIFRRLRVNRLMSGQDEKGPHRNILQFKQF